MPPYGSLPQPGQAPWTTRGPREGAQKPSAEGARQFGNVWASPVAMGVISPTDPILQGWKWDQYKGEWKKDVDWAYRISLPIALGGLGAAGLSAAGAFAGAGPPPRLHLCRPGRGPRGCRARIVSRYDRQSSGRGGDPDDGWTPGHCGN